MLEEGVGDHYHQYMTIKTLPRSSLEVVETEFLLELLMGLLANPPRLDRGSQSAQGPSQRAGGALPGHLPRVHVTVEPDDTHCPCCRAPMRQLLTGPNACKAH